MVGGQSYEGAHLDSRIDHHVAETEHTHQHTLLIHCILPNKCIPNYKYKTLIYI